MFRGDSNLINIDGIIIKVDSQASELTVKQVVPYLLKSESETFQTALQLARVGMEQGLIEVQALNVFEVSPNEALAYVEHFPSGHKNVVLPTKDQGAFYRAFAHEVGAHATLPLGNPFTSQTNYSWHQTYQDKMRRAFCTDYWDFKRGTTFSPAQVEAARYFFYPNGGRKFNSNAQLFAEGYPKFQWPSERMAKSMEYIAANELLFAEISPRFTKIIKEYVAKQATIPVVANYNLTTQQSVKLWDASTQSSNLYLKNNFSHAVQPIPSEPTVINWRPGISEAKRAPWYNTVNWQGVGNLGLSGLKIGVPLYLTGWEYSNRLAQEQANYPQYSKAAQNLAATSSMALDYVTAARLVKLAPAGVALPALAIADIMGAVAYAARDIPPEAMMENEDYLTAMMIGLEFSPFVQQIVLDDHRRGGTMSRNMIKNSVIVTKTSLKPLEKYHEFKLTVTGVVRESVQYISQEMFYPHPANYATPTNKPSSRRVRVDDDTPEIFAKKNQPQQPKPPVVQSTQTLASTNSVGPIAQVFQQNNPLPQQFQPAPLIPTSALAPQFFAPHTFNISNSSTNNMLLTIDRNNPLLSPELHAFLYEISQYSHLENVPHTDIKATNEIKNTVKARGTTSTNQKEYQYVPPKFEGPLSNVHIGSVQGKPGLLIDLKSGGTIGISAGLTHFILQVSADFGPEFYAAMGEGLLVAAPIALGLMAAQYIYKQHLKHVEHKIKHGLKNTNSDIQKISTQVAYIYDKYKDPQASETANYQQEINQTIQQIQDKISKENSRKHYASHHSGKDARNQHRRVIAGYKKAIADLYDLKTGLELNKIKKDFIDAHKNSSDAELISQAETLTKHIESQKDWRSQLTQLHKDGYNIKSNKGSSRHGGHMTAQQAIAWVESGKSILAKKRRCDNVEVKKSEFDQDVQKIKGIREVLVVRFANKAAVGKMQEALDLINKIPNDYKNGNNGDLNFDSFKILLQKFIADENKPAAEWFIELDKATTGSNLLGTDQLNMLKNAVYFHAVTDMYEQASQGDLTNAKELALQAKQKLPEHDVLFTQYASKFEELKPFMEKNATFWLKRIESAQALPKDKIDPGVTLEIDLAEQFVLNQAISYATQGEFTQSEKILAQLKTLAPNQTDSVQSLVAKMNELKPQYENWDFCIKTLKVLDSKPKKEWKIADVLEYNIINRSTTKKIFLKVINEEFDDAKKLCEQVTREIPSKKDDMSSYQTAIDDVAKLKGANNDTILLEMEKIKDVSSKGNELKSTVLNAKFMSNLSVAVLDGKSVEAKTHLEKLKQQDKSKTQLCDSLIQLLDHHDTNTKNGLDFWKKEFDNYHDAKPAVDEDGMVVDTHFHDKNEFGKVIAKKNILNVIADKSQDGFNCEAADIIDWLSQRDTNPKYQEYKQDLLFAHEGQVLSIFAKPAQVTLARIIKDMKPSYQRSALSLTLNTVDVAQMLVPSFPVLFSQRAYAQFTGLENINTANRNIIKICEKTWEKFKQDINPRNGVLNSATLYGSVIFKFFQNFPLQSIVSPKKLHAAEMARQQIVSYGNIGNRIYSVGQSAWQLAQVGKKITAYTPNYAMPIITATLDVVYWGYDKIFYPNGNENASTYYYRNGFSWMLQAGEAFVCASLLTRNSKSYLPFLAALVVSGFGYYNTQSKSAEAENTERALLNSINNLHAQNKLEDKLKDKKAIQLSKEKIELHLKGFFNGLIYQADHSEAVNNARLTHFYQTVKEAFDNKNYDEVLQLTEAIDYIDKKVIGEAYQIPIHLVWHVIVFFRLLTHLEAKELKTFQVEYENYAHHIFLSADNNSPWYQANWENVLIGFQNILSYAFQHFTIAAQNALKNQNPEEALIYLSWITRNYLHVKESWHQILSDEFKFWVAYLYMQLDQKKDCELFFNNIHNLDELLKQKQNNDKAFTSNALELLTEVQSPEHSSLLTKMIKGTIQIIDGSLYSYILRLIEKNNYQAAEKALNESNNFIGKEAALAHLTFNTSNYTDIFGTLEHLLKVQEQDRDLSYWCLFHDVMMKILDSIKYAPNSSLILEATAKICGFIKICADYIQKFPIPKKLKQQTEKDITFAMNTIQTFVWQKYSRACTSSEQLNEKVNALIEYGHKCIRGDEAIDLMAEIKNILRTISYQYNDNSQLNQFTAIEVPANGDCAFYVLGITREEGIKKLLEHIDNICIEQILETTLSTSSNSSDQSAHLDTILNILLDDLAYQNKVKNDRSSASFEDNIALVRTYLYELSKPYIWMPCNPGKRSVLDALALLLEKNLKIYLADHQNKLVLLSTNIHNVFFETIDMLFTQASGTSYDQRTCNHYVKLIPLVSQIVELVEEKTSTSSPTSTIGIFKTAHASTTTPNNVTPTTPQLN